MVYKNRFAEINLDTKFPFPGQYGCEKSTKKPRFTVLLLFDDRIKFICQLQLPNIELCAH